MITNMNDYSSITTGIGAIIIGFLLLILVFALIVGIFTVICRWKIFKKAGEEGWKAIIPFYNQYILCKIVGVNPWWILIYFCSFALSSVPMIGSTLQLVVIVYYGILVNVSLAKSFGKDTGFAVGLYFLSPVFNAILAFGKSEYLGACPMNDIIFKNNNNSTNVETNTEVNNSSEQKEKNTKVCPNCGNEIENNSLFCPNCGNKID